MEVCLLFPASSPASPQPPPTPKAQLSEKLRRLRKKFHALSASILHPHWTALQVNPARRPEPVKEEEQDEEEEKLGSSPPPPPEVRQRDRKKENIGSFPSGGLGGVVAKAVMDVFDGALEEVKAALDVDTAPSSSSSTSNDLDSRCREQRALEFEPLSR